MDASHHFWNTEIKLEGHQQSTTITVTGKKKIYTPGKGYLLQLETVNLSLWMWFDCVWNCSLDFIKLFFSWSVYLILSLFCLPLNVAMGVFMGSPCTTFLFHSIWLVQLLVDTFIHIDLITYSCRTIAGAASLWPYQKVEEFTGHKAQERGKVVTVGSYIPFTVNT